MEDKNKIELAYKEIGYCQDLKVCIADGKVVKICKGRYYRATRNGVKCEIVIDEDIVI